MRILRIVPLVTFLISTSMVFGQNEDVVLNLTGTEFNGKVILSWSVVQGNTCNGIQVLQSVDSTNFDQIGSIEGICGSTAATIKYQFTDQMPESNSINYYRLSLGGIGFSYIIQVDVVEAGEQNFVVAPNPLVDQSILVFDNDNQEGLTMTVFSEGGEIVTEYRTNGESIELDRNNFGVGTFIFVLKSDGEQAPITGKFIVY